MSLMGDLHMGTSGLKVSQYGLNTTAHNLANVETAGYVRQQTVLRSSFYNKIGETPISFMQTGNGVDVQAVRQVRDAFLDKSYRLEVGRQGFYEAFYDATTELEQLFGELQGVAFQGSMNDMWVSMQELAKEPDSLVTQATFVQTAVNFVERSEEVYEQMCSYQLSLNTMIGQKVERVNEISARLDELNDKVALVEANHLEHANDYRDERNALLDELGQIIKITYNEHIDGRITVLAEEAPLVTDNSHFEMGTMTMADLLSEQGEDVILDEMSKIIVPVWPAYGNAEVINMDIVPRNEANTNIGSLKGMLIARGIGVGKFTDIPICPKEESYMDEDGVLDADAYMEALSKYDDEVETYNKVINPSVMMNVQAQFDQLIHGIVTMVNNVLAPLKEVKISAGTTVEMNDGTDYTFEEDSVLYILDEENAPIGLDEEAQPGLELFSRKSVDRYLNRQDLMGDDGTLYENALIYRWEDATDNYSMYTLGEIEVNPEILENKSKLPLISNNGTRDYDMETVEKLLSEWQKEFATLSPNTLTYNNFTDYYTQFIGALGTVGDEYGTLSRSQASEVGSIQNQRLSVTAVASDEELTSLIKYQHAYNASARYINVVSEMLEHIITNM